MKMNKVDIFPGDNQICEIIHPTVATDSHKSSKQTKVTLSTFEMYDKLIQYCRSNVQYFGCDSDTLSKNRFLDAFRNILQHIEIIRKHVAEICGFVHEYDFDENTLGSGYRSILKVTHEYIKHTVKVSKYIAESRGNFLFRKRKYVK